MKKPDFTPDERHILTGAGMSEVGEAALTAFLQVFGAARLPLRVELMRLGPGRTQRMVDVLLTATDCALPIAELTERFLRPMAACLAGSMPRGQAFGMLELPSGCQAARASRDNVSIRIVTGMRPMPVFDDDGEIVGYDPDKPVIRMDAITTSEPLPIGGIPR